MRPEIETLCRVLEEELGILSDLLATQAREKTALVRLETLPLADAVSRVEAVLVRLSLAEQARVALTRRIGESLRLPAAQLNLREIALRVEEPYRERLIELRDAMQKSARDLSRANELNQALTLQGIDHADLLLSILLGGADAPQTYTRAGVERRLPVGPRRVLDQVV